MSKLKMVADPGKQETVLTYVFDAPRERVFKSYTNPDLIPQWWGPRYLSTEVERMEVKPGGTWRYIQRDDTGNLYVFNGVYHEIVSPERLTYTFEYEGEPGHILLVTVRFEEMDGKTLIIEKSIYQSVEDRDGMISEGMESGADESMDRLADLLAIQ